MSVARKVLVVEDDRLLCGLLAQLLAERGFAVLQAHDSATAMNLVDSADPDALIIDLDLGVGPSGFDIIEALGERLAEFGVLVLSNYPSPAFLRPGSALPPSIGFLLKHQLSKPDEIVQALESVLRDDAPARLAAGQVPEALAGLTPNQFALLRLIALGYSNEMIARERGVALRSVESLVNRLFTALDLSADPRSNARVKAAMLYARAMGVPRPTT